MNKFFNFDTSEITPIHRAVHTEAKETFAKYELPESDKRDYIDEKLHVEIATLMYQLVDLPNAIDSETIVKGMLEGMNRTIASYRANSGMCSCASCLNTPNKNPDSLMAAILTSPA